METWYCPECRQPTPCGCGRKAVEKQPIPTFDDYELVLLRGLLERYIRVGATAAEWRDIGRQMLGVLETLE